MGQSANMLYSVFLSKLNTHSPIGSGVFFSTKFYQRVCFYTNYLTFFVVPFTRLLYHKIQGDAMKLSCLKGLTKEKSAPYLLLLPKGNRNKMRQLPIRYG